MIMTNKIQSKEWQVWIQRYRKSGLSLRKFCQTYRLSPYAMRYHLKKAQRVQFAEITVVEKPCNPITIWVGEHFKIIIGTDINHDALVPLLKAAKEATCS
jgi:hypothetical protein